MPSLCRLAVHAVLGRVARLTSDQDGYSERNLLAVTILVREGGADGRGRAMYRKSCLGKNVSNSQIYLS